MLSASTSMPCSSIRRIHSSAMTSDAGASFRPISAIASGTPQCACTSTVFTRRPLTTTSRRRGACARAAGSPSHSMNAMPVSAAALLTNSLRVVIFLLPSPLILQEERRVDGDRVEIDREVQMRPGDAARGAHLADDAAGGHGLRHRRLDGFQVSVEREQALPVVEDDGAAREEVIAGVDDAPG